MKNFKKAYALLLLFGLGCTSESFVMASEGFREIGKRLSRGESKPMERTMPEQQRALFAERQQRAAQPELLRRINPLPEGQQRLATIEPFTQPIDAGLKLSRVDSERMNAQHKKEIINLAKQHIQERDFAENIKLESLKSKRRAEINISERHQKERIELFKKQISEQPSHENYLQGKRLQHHTQEVSNMFDRHQNERNAQQRDHSGIDFKHLAEHRFLSVYLDQTKPQMHAAEPTPDRVTPEKSTAKERTASAKALSRALSENKDEPAAAEEPAPDRTTSSLRPTMSDTTLGDTTLGDSTTSSTKSIKHKGSRGKPVKLTHERESFTDIQSPEESETLNAIKDATEKREADKDSRRAKTEAEQKIAADRKAAQEKETEQRRDRSKQDQRRSKEQQKAKRAEQDRAQQKATTEGEKIRAVKQKESDDNLLKAFKKEQAEKREQTATEKRSRDQRSRDQRSRDQRSRDQRKAVKQELDARNKAKAQEAETQKQQAKEEESIAQKQEAEARAKSTQDYEASKLRKKYERQQTHEDRQAREQAAKRKRNQKAAEARMSDEEQPPQRAYEDQPPTGLQADVLSEEQPPSRPRAKSSFRPDEIQALNDSIDALAGDLNRPDTIQQVKDLQEMAGESIGAHDPVAAKEIDNDLKQATEIITEKKSQWETKAKSLLERIIQRILRFFGKDDATKLIEQLANPETTLSESKKIKIKLHAEIREMGHSPEAIKDLANRFLSKARSHEAPTTDEEAKSNFEQEGSKWNDTKDILHKHLKGKRIVLRIRK